MYQARMYYYTRRVGPQGPVYFSRVRCSAPHRKQPKREPQWQINPQTSSSSGSELPGLSTFRFFSSVRYATRFNHMCTSILDSHQKLLPTNQNSHPSTPQSQSNASLPHQHSESLTVVIHICAKLTAPVIPGYKNTLSPKNELIYVQRTPIRNCYSG